MDQNQLPIVTTILTTYRRPALLKRAIISVLNQTYPLIRLLVLDDASGDETEEIVTKIASKDSRVIYVRHEKNIGMTPNWRFGLEHVDTPYFSFLSDDDIHLPHFYQKAIEYLEKNKEVGFYCGETIVFNEKGQIGRVSGDGWEEGIHFPYAGMLEMMEHAISWNGILFRKEVFDTSGTLSDIHSTDFEFLVRAARNFSFFVCHEPCAMFMEHKNRGWGYYDNQKIFYQFYNMAIQILNELPPEIQASAWVILNKLGFVISKYLFITYLINREPQKAHDIALYMKKFTLGSREALKFELLAKFGILFPVICDLSKRKIMNGTFKNGRKQKIYREKYGKWIDYSRNIC